MNASFAPDVAGELRNLLPVIDDSNTSTMTSVNDKNQTGNDATMVKWYHLTEAVIVALVSLVGVVCNVVVLRGAIKAQRFARQNVYLFLGLSLSDLFVCLIRGPSLILILLRTDNGSDAICEIWVFSGIFIFVGIFMNTIVAIERRMIINNFQTYLKWFTRKRVIFTTVLFWTCITTAFVAVYMGFFFRSMYHSTESACYIESSLIHLDNISSTIFRVTVLTIGGLVPICVQGFCYITLILRIFKAEILKLEKINGKETYSLIIRIAFARVVLIITCLLPVLICFAIGPHFAEVYYANVRYFDYLLLLRSSISAFITMHDTDFKETFVRNKWRFTSTLKRTGSKKGSRRSYITSAELKTIG
ncbi:hypothetical protein ACF0H5_020653 [Mactra antiquata]